MKPRIEKKRKQEPDTEKLWVNSSPKDILTDIKKAKEMLEENRVIALTPPFLVWPRKYETKNHIYFVREKSRNGIHEIIYQSVYFLLYGL